MQARILLPLFILVFIQIACSLPELAEKQNPEEPLVTQEPLMLVENKPTETLPLPSSTVEVIPTTTAPSPAQMPDMLQELEIAGEVSEISVDDPKYTIIQNKPVLEGSEKLINDINQQIDQLYRVQIEDFTRQVEETEQWRVENMPELFSSLDISYELAHFSDGLISIYFPVDVYFAGAAHPNHYTLVINYDLQESRQIQLGDLFIMEDRALQKIANHCIDELKGQQDMIWEEGLQPTEANYRNWNISSEGLLIRFDPYQAAPYAAGTLTINVPWEVLSEEINPNGSLARFLLK